MDLEDPFLPFPQLDTDTQNTKVGNTSINYTILYNKPPFVVKVHMYLKQGDQAALVDRVDLEALRGP